MSVVSMTSLAGLQSTIFMEDREMMISWFNIDLWKKTMS